MEPGDTITTTKPRLAGSSTCFARHSAICAPHISLSALYALLLLLCPCSIQKGEAQELDLLNRPVNVSGLTGLIQTTSPFVLPAKTFEICPSVQSLNSLSPSFSLNEYSLGMGAGIGNNMEFAVRSAYYTYNRDSSGTRLRNTDDIDLAFKWNFIRQQDPGAFEPAVSLLLGAAIPAKHRDLLTSTVDHWSATLGIALGSELAWLDHTLALYGDAKMTVQDLSQTASRDRYYTVNAGILFPISKARNLQMLVEYTIVSGRDVLLVSGGDHGAVTYGLRLVNERFNLTIGTQFIHNKEDGFSDSSRVTGILSYKI